MSRTEQALDELAPSEPVPEGEPPRLAAIIFTDVVGYSKRMREDERQTIAAVQADFDAMRAMCAKHGGEVVNTMGDGMMLSFPGAVAAMQFALAMQTAFAQRSVKAAGPRPLKHRIGVHIGDVYRVAGGHLAGDGVNIAARLEPRSPHGGIAVSQMVYDAVKGKVPMRAHLMGPQNFKNINEPITVWGVMPLIDDPNAVRVIEQHHADDAPRRSPLLRTVIWLGVLAAAIYLLWPNRERLMHLDLAGVLHDIVQRLQALVT